MKVKSKLISPEKIAQFVADYMEGASVVDLARMHGISYEGARQILVKELHHPRPHQVRKADWEAKNVKIVSTTQTRVSRTRKSKLIPIVKELVLNKDKSFAAIANDLNISRERVGQVAELCALAKWDVSRGRAVRGKITT
jgi:transposase-like protein